MRALSKFGAVAAGYAAAFGIASACLYAYVALTDTPDRVASSGMYAFGDGMLFLAVFAIAAIPATCAALYFLRPLRGFWYGAATLAVASALVAVAALYEAILVHGTDDLHTAVGMLAALSPVRILVAPGAALASLCAAIFSPLRGPRRAFVGACITESLVFAAGVSAWILSATR